MKSPLKDNPLRNPGESLDRKIDDFVYDEILLYLFIGILMFTTSLTEWFRWYYSVPPNPFVYTIVAVIVIVFSVVKILKAKSKLKALKQGRDGEKSVGQYLEKLRKHGAQVFHDIPSKGFNLDHVVIMQSGVYVIETKTYSKPDKGEAKINWNLDANKVLSHIHGLSPSPGAWFEFENERFKVLRAKISTLNGKSSSVLDENLTIACKLNSIQILELQRQGKNKQTTKEFLLGRKIGNGSILV